MEQELIRQQLTKAFALAPMSVAVLIALDDNGPDTRIGEVFNSVLADDKYNAVFTKGFELGSIGSEDMQNLIEGGLGVVDAALQLATVAINQLSEQTEQALHIKMRLFEFAEDMALRMDNLQPGEEQQLADMYQAKLNYLSTRLGMQEDMDKLA